MGHDRKLNGCRLDINTTVNTQLYQTNTLGRFNLDRLELSVTTTNHSHSIDIQDNFAVVDGGIFCYFDMALIIISLFFILLFILLAYNQLSLIAEKHDTVSSFCSNTKHFGHRFLLAITWMSGSGLSCLLVEEYNSRYDGDFRFWLEILCTLALPLVGMFPSKNGDIEKVEKSTSTNIFKTAINNIIDLWDQDTDFGENSEYRFPQLFSTAAHYIGALPFIFLLPSINVWYGAEVYYRNQGGLAVFVLALITLVCVVVFLVLQGVIAIAECCGTENTYIKKVRIASFISEFGSVFLTVFVTMLASIKRNNNITWFQ
jgi:hypothetical protein